MSQSHDPRSLTTDEIASFEEAATSRPAVMGRRGATDLKSRLWKHDPFRMALVRSHVKWLKKRCDKWGIPYEEVMWWDL